MNLIKRIWPRKEVTMSKTAEELGMLTVHGGMAAPGIANSLTPYQQQMNQAMAAQAMQAGYANQGSTAVPLSKYKTLAFRVEEIANGFVVERGADRYYCEDIATVGIRVTMLLAAQELGK